MKQSLKRKRLAHKFLHNLELIKLVDFLFSGIESQVHSVPKTVNDGKNHISAKNHRTMMIEGLWNSY